MKDKLNPIEKVYNAFYNSKKKAMYFNEIREKAKMSISSLQNALSKLEKSKEAEKTRETANTFFSLKDKELIALNFEKFDIQKLNSLNIDVKIPLKDFLGNIPTQIEFILLFGSSSRKEEKKGSDIDLLVVTHYFEDKKLNELYQKEIKKNIEEIRKRINTRSIYPLSIVFVDNKDYKERKDYLLGDAKKTGFCIYNHEAYYKEELKDEN